MNYMEKIAEMLGVQMGEEFKIQSKYIYAGEQIFVITENGIRSADRSFKDHSVLNNLLTGIFTVEKLQWKPKPGDYVYYIGEPGDVRRERFYSCLGDFALYKIGKLYRTHKEAEAHAEEDKAYWESIRKELEE